MKVVVTFGLGPVILRLIISYGGGTEECANGQSLFRRVCPVVRGFLRS